MNSEKEVTTKVINGHMYEISEDKTQAKPVALSKDAAIAAKSDPEHYLNKTLELDPKTLEPIIKNEEKKATNKLQEMLAKSKSEELEESEVKDIKGPDFV
jgi:hypothetical protein